MKTLKIRSMQKMLILLFLILSGINSIGQQKQQGAKIEVDFAEYQRTLTNLAAGVACLEMQAEKDTAISRANREIDRKEGVIRARIAERNTARDELRDAKVAISLRDNYIIERDQTISRLNTLASKKQKKNSIGIGIGYGAAFVDNKVRTGPQIGVYYQRAIFTF